MNSHSPYQIQNGSVTLPSDGGSGSSGAAGLFQLSDGTGGFAATEGSVSATATIDADGFGTPGIIYTDGSRTAEFTPAFGFNFHGTDQAGFNNTDPGAVLAWSITNTGIILTDGFGAEIIFGVSGHAIFDETTGALDIGNPTGPAASAGDVNIAGDFKRNGVIISTGTGTVTQIVAGAGLSGGTITSAGTVSLGTIAASSLMGNAGTAGAVPGAITIDPSLSLNVGGTLALGAIASFGSGGTTAVAGAATLNSQNGVVTSEALVAATTYTLTLTNNKISGASSTVLVNLTNSAGLPVTLTSVTPGTNSVVIVVGMAALTGTVKIAFAAFN